MSVLKWIPLIALCVLLPACTGSPPELLFAEARLFLRLDPSSRGASEHLEMYAAVRDDDGDDDVASLLIVHDESELVWEFSRDEWVSLTYGGDRWIGSPDLRVPDARRLPRGEYRVIVRDAAHQESTASFYVISPELEPDEITFPTLSRVDSVTSVVAFGTVTIRVYSRTGALVVNEAVGSGRLPGDLFGRIAEHSGGSVYVQQEHASGVMLIAGPYEVSALTRR